MYIMTYIALYKVTDAILYLALIILANYYSVLLTPFREETLHKDFSWYTFDDAKEVSNFVLDKI